jgi:hypothetical protein
MQNALKQRIADERTRTSALDATLTFDRTPYLKSQLRFAGHLLDEADDALGHVAKGQADYDYMWLGFAKMNIQHAAQRREKVQELVNRYGGPDNAVEI